MLFVVILFPILNSTIACALFFIILFCAWLSCKRYSLKKITSSYLSYAEGNTSYFNNAHSNGFRTHFLSPCMPFSFYVPMRFTALFLTSMRTFVLQFILVHFINVDCFVVFEFIGSYITIFSYLSYLCVRNSVFL